MQFRTTPLLRFIFFAVVIGLFATLTLADSDHVELKLVWRQQFVPVPASASSIFFKPSSINTSFVVRTVMQGDQLIVFDSGGQPTQRLSFAPDSELKYSPSQSAATLEQFQSVGVPAGADDVPILVTGIVNGRQVWQRTSTSGAITLIGDSGASVDLNLYVGKLDFFDATGNPVKSVLPFKRALPWSFERPAFGAFSADGASFALLATEPNFGGSTLFVFDSFGTLRASQPFPQFKEAAGVGISPQGSNFLVAGWTDNPVINPQAVVTGALLDIQGNNLGQIEIPPIGEQVVISFDPAGGQFVLSNGSGTILRVAPNSTPQSFTVGSGLAPTAVASAGRLTAIATLEPLGSQTNQSNLVLRILDANGTLLLQRALGGNTVGLDSASVWLSSDGNFVAVRFADEIRYYNLR